MTQHDGPEAIDEIDIFVAVDVPDARTLRTIRDDGIDHLLPLRAETRHDARIGEYLAVLLRQALRFGRPPRDPVDQNASDAALAVPSVLSTLPVCGGLYGPNALVSSPVGLLGGDRRTGIRTRR